MIAPAELYPSAVVPHEGVVFAHCQVDRPAPCSVVARRASNRVGSGSAGRGLHPIPRRICLSGSDPGVAETVDSAGTLFREGEPVLGRSVAAVAPKAVAGMGLGEGAHRVVA